MLGKQRAARIAREERLTWGKLKNMIDRSPMAGPSSVNKTISLVQVAAIHLAVISQREPREYPKAWRPDPYTGRIKPSRDFLIVVNILRDFGSSEMLTAAQVDHEEYPDNGPTDPWQTSTGRAEGKP